MVISVLVWLLESAAIVLTWILHQLKVNVNNVGSWFTFFICYNLYRLDKRCSVIFLESDSVNYRPAPTCRARKPGMRGVGDDVISIMNMKVLSGE